MDSARRDIFRALPAILCSTGLLGDEQKTLPSHIYDFDAMPVRNAGSLIYRGIFDGTIYEGCHISLHESDLAPHSEPHPPHQHRHEEMVLILEGTLEFTINGKSTRAGAGSVMFAGSNDLHGIRNPDDSHAKYFVFALGPENR
jgi:mannose-6-phosphate isomerase-like protein (cupin superfamily)